MSKKTFYIILIIIVCLLVIGLLVWYFFFKPSTPTAPPEGAGFTAPGQETSKGWQPISEGLVISARFSGDNSILFYDFSGNLWQFKNGDPKPSLLNQTTIQNPAEIIWSANEKNIVKSGIDQSDIDYVFSDFGQRTFVNLKTGIKSIVFSPDAKKIAYQISDSKSNALFTSDPDGKNQKNLIKDFKLRDITLNWPKTDQMAFVSKPSGLIPGSLWTLDAKNLKIAKLIDNLFGLEVLFSPDGNSFVYSYTDQNGQNPKLALYKNNASKNIEGVSTLIDKCAWAPDSLNVYCAVPGSWLDSAVLPDDYYKNASLTIDNLWKINIETGEKNLIFQGIGDISSLDVNSDDNSLIFVSRNSGFLYQLNLTP